MAEQGEPQVQLNPSSGSLESSLETLTWSLLPCLLLPHQRLSRTLPWWCSVSMI
uniref:Uncharacterized protein n=1 Tax=Urocitellus parryii TaxID=9999 RepID=A0A8D2H1J7_UROPR